MASARSRGVIRPQPDPSIGDGDIAIERRPTRSPVRQILHSASATLVLQGLALLLGFGTSVLLAHLLGATGYGRYVYALAWGSLLALPAILGLDRFLVRGIAVYEVEQNWSLMRGLLRRTSQLVLLSSTAVAMAGCLVSALWLPSSLRGPLCVAMLLIPFTTLTLVRQGAMQAIGRVVSGQLPEYVIRPIVALVAIALIELVGHRYLTATTALAANVTGVAVAFAVGVVLLRRALPRELDTVTPTYDTRTWLVAALPMMLIAGVWLANNYVATLVVGTLDGSRAAGVYSVVDKGAELIVLVLVAANMPLAPVVARMHARKDRAGLQHATERVAQAAFVVSLPVAAIFAIFPNVYLGLFGSTFSSGAGALRVLAVAQLVNAAAGPAGNLLIMTGHERAAVSGVAAGLIANLALGVVLVPRYGVIGGAAASAASLVLWNTVLVVLARRHVGVNVTALGRLRVADSADADPLPGLAEQTTP